MNKKSAMSAIGYAIVSVIVLALIMIISAPMLVNNVKDEKKVQEPVQNFEVQDNSDLRMLEERLSSRIDNLERRQTVSNKYVCSIEGKLDENGEIVPVDNSGSSEKFVFVCEYRR